MDRLQAIATGFILAIGAVVALTAGSEISSVLWPIYFEHGPQCLSALEKTGSPEEFVAAMTSCLVFLPAFFIPSTIGIFLAFWSIADIRIFE